MIEKDPFAVLGVSFAADDVVVAAAYKALAKKYHPDINPDGASKMQEINEAYDAIKNKNYHDEYYYYPERRPFQNTSTRNDDPKTTNSQPVWTEPSEPSGEEQWVNSTSSQKRQWTYNGRPVKNLGVALLLSFRDRWLLPLVLYVIIPCIALDLLLRFALDESLLEFLHGIFQNVGQTYSSNSIVCMNCYLRSL